MAEYETDLTFIGTGEAFDAERANASYLLKDKDGCLMVDCGYTAPFSLRRLEGNIGGVAESPNALLITHFHGDHTGGIGALLMPIWEEVNGIVGKNKSGRERRLTIASAHSDIRQHVANRMQDYPGFLERFDKEGPTLDYKIINPSGDSLLGYSVRSALTVHGLANFAYRFDKSGKSFAISGDGAFTDASRDLFKGTQFLAHEGFYVDTTSKNHASIKEVVDYAIEANILRVAIVHVNREELQKTEEIIRMIERGREKGIEVSFPEDHSHIDI